MGFCVFFFKFVEAFSRDHPVLEVACVCLQCSCGCVSKPIWTEAGHSVPWVNNPPDGFVCHHSLHKIWHLLFIDFIEFSSVACEIVARHTVDPEDGHFEGWNSCKPVDSSRKSPRPPVRSGTVLQAGGSCEVATLIRTKTIEVSGQN